MANQHKATVTSGGPAVLTTKPEKNEYVANWGEEQGYARAEREGMAPILIAGGQSFEAGDTVEMFDDGNLHTRFGTKVGRAFVVTHTAATLTELRAFPKARLRMYVLK